MKNEQKLAEFRAVLARNPIKIDELNIGDLVKIYEDLQQPSKFGQSKIINNIHLFLGGVELIRMNPYFPREVKYSFKDNALIKSYSEPRQQIQFQVYGIQDQFIRIDEPSTGPLGDLFPTWVSVKYFSKI